MASFNRVVLVGNLTRDPDYKQLTSGQAVCKLGLATNRQFKNKQTGAMIQEVCFIDVDVWGVQAESCKQYLQKGRAVLIEGRLKFDTWEDPQGQTRSKHSIVADRVVFLGSGQGTTDVVEQESGVNDRLDLNNPKEKELFEQIEQIKSRTQTKTAGAKTGAVDARPPKKPSAAQNNSATSTGEIAFVDEPPFQDDLPF